jgi:hypothetical protein
LTPVETDATYAAADLLSSSATESELNALLSALLRICQNLAFDLAQREGERLIEVNAQEAARVIDES